MKKLILLTGAHRSGSTWAGRIISTSDQVRYVHEPFNIAEWKHTPLNYWYEYLSQNTAQEHQQKVKAYLSTFWDPSLATAVGNFSRIRSPRLWPDFFKDINKRKTCRTIMKDPLALMSAEWLYREYNCDVIFTIRHPAAFVASIKVKDWQFDFNDYLYQEPLMNAYLAPYQQAILDYTKHPRDIIKQGILLWNTIYSTVNTYMEKYGDLWYYITHEDLSYDPLTEFKKIFKYLDLEFTAAAEKEVIDSSSASEASNLKRDSRQNIKSWKKRLSAEEIEMIKKDTQHVWKHYYTDDDWS